MSKSTFVELRDSTVQQPIGKKLQLTKDANILTWGDDNLYPYFLNFLYSKSAIHRGLINGKVQYYKSKQVTIDTNFDKNGTSPYKISELNEKLLLDYETKNAFAILVSYNAIIKSNEYDYIDIDTVRIDISGDYFYVSDNWCDGKRAKFKKYANYFVDEAKARETESLAVYYGDVKSFFDPNEKKFIKLYYPEPTYNGAIDSILTDIEICHFNYSEIINGFAGGTLIAMNNGIPETIDEENRIKRDLKDSITNRDKKGGVTVAFSNDKNSAPEIIPINGNNLVDRYSTLTDDVLQRIIIGHNITSPLLVGVKTEGQLGGTTELQIAKEIFEEKYIIPRLKAFYNFLNQVYYSKIILQFSEHEHTHVHIPISPEEDEKILAEFDKYGKNKKDLSLLEDTQEFDLPETNLISKYQKFDLKLTKLQDKVLGLISNGNDLKEIATALSIEVKKVTEVYNELKNLKLLTDDNELTKVGKKALQNETILQIYYEYKVRPGLGEPIIDTTRPFCRTLIKKNKVYTREEISQISSAVGRDVWYYRGGWFHDKRDDKTYPFCRHYWYQVIGIEKK